MSESSNFSLGTVIAQIKQIITNPVEFYRNMPKTGGYGEPIIFLLVAAVGGGIVLAALSIIGLSPAGLGMAGLGAIIMFPIGGLIGSFFVAAVLFIIWKLMGSSENYETAYRCVAYSFALMPAFAVLMMIPYLGTVIRTLWGTWLVIIQSTEVHGRTQQTSKLVFGILAVIFVIGGLRAEYATRQITDQMEEFRAGLSQAQSNALENLEEMTPEEMGRAAGEFFKGLENAAKQAEEGN
ncbi:MAG: hypothetical protein HOM55_04275 [Proteobacteria bacterium]|jgi:hypothetical protein|nr:hypothetical protein [Pseudomonadota bacterium]